MGEPEGFVWQFLRKLWRSPESMTGGIGITFRLMNQGLCVFVCWNYIPAANFSLSCRWVIVKYVCVCVCVLVHICKILGF